MSGGIFHSAADRPRSQGHQFDASSLIATLCYMFNLGEMSISDIDRLIERRVGEAGHYYMSGLMRLGFNLCVFTDFDYDRALSEGLPYLQQYDLRHRITPSVTTPSEYDAWLIFNNEIEWRIEQSGPGVCQRQLVDVLTQEHLVYLVQQGPVVINVNWDPQTATSTLALAYIYQDELHVYEPYWGDYVSSIPELWQKRAAGTKLVLVRR